MQTFTDYIKSKKYPLLNVFVWGRSYSYLDHVLSGDGHTQSLYNLMRGCIRPQPYHPLFILGCLYLMVIFCITVFGTEHLNPMWMSVMGGGTEKCWIYQFGTFSSHLFTKRPNVLSWRWLWKEKYINKTFMIYHWVVVKYIQDPFENCFQPLENEIYVAATHKKLITCHTVPILKP